MKRKTTSIRQAGTLVAWCAAGVLSAQVQTRTQQQAGSPDVEELLHHYDHRIEFIANKGQFADGVLYLAQFPSGQALATPEGMVMMAYDPAAIATRQAEGMRIEQEMQDGKGMRPLTWRRKGHGWMMAFQNASPAMRIEAQGAHEEVNNYFLGGRSATDVRSHQEVWYRGVYPGTDVRYYPAADGALEYDIICKPGSDPGQIALRMKGIDRLRVNERGELVMTTSLGEMTYPAPFVYQGAAGHEKRIEARYVVSDGNVLGFQLGRYDHGQSLVIDPIAMRWATLVNTNSSDDNHGHAIWVDPTDGSIYVLARVVGTTDNITLGAFDTSANGNLETIVGKYLEPTTVGGSGTRVWQTYIGGGGDDNPYAMEQGPDGNLYITGQTSSTDFPTLGGTAFTGSSLNQQSQSDIDVFVLKITQDGQSIKAAVVGGNGADDNFDVRLAGNGDVFVCGSTTSTNLLTLNAGSGASNTNNGGSDVFLFRINQDLSSLAWMRNYGGSSADRASIMLHNPTSGDLFVGGNTSSTNFPTTSPRQSVRGGTAAGFLQRLSGTTAATTWSSYFASASSQSANLLCMEFNTTKDQLFFGGVTTGLNSDNIVSGSFDTDSNGNNDFYVARMGIDQTFIAGTYVGGSSNEVNMMGLNVDLNNDAYIFGYTNSTNFPVSSAPNVPLQATNQGENDKVFFKMDGDLDALEYSTYYGGTTDDYDPVGERGIKFSNCRIYTIVTAESNNAPLTQGALNTTKLSSSTTIYEPGLVVWANPPDLLGNTITYQGTAICAGSVPGDISGSVPSYVLPTVVRNNAASAYPSLGSAATYQWQISNDSTIWTDIPGATGQNLAGSQIGVVNQKTFLRRIIGGDACILAGAADQVVTVHIMSVTGTMTQPLCNGAANGNIVANADGEAPFNYAWSNGQSGQTATGLIAGSYSVIVTDNNGCSSGASFELGQPTQVGGSVQVTPATCGNANGSANANGAGGTPGYTYLWSEGTTGAVLSGVAPGAYSVTITDANQCSVVIPVQINGTSLPGAQASGGTLTCTTTSVMLMGSGNGSYSWTGPNSFTSNDQNPTVMAAGTYVLTVLGDNGCTSTANAEVILNDEAPGAQASGGTLTCTTTSVMLMGSGNGSYSWTGPNSFTSNDQNPTVMAAGTYVLTVLGDNGCTSTANAEVILNDEAPGAQASGGTLTCTTTSVMLMGSGNGSYSWTGPNSFTSNDQNPTVMAAGTYVLTVLGDNGCTSTANAEVILNDEAPGAQASGGTLTCTTTSVMLMGSGNGSYSWTGPNSFTSNDQNPTVMAAGTYVLTVLGDNGCTSTANAEVILNDEAPGAQASGGTLTCTTTSVMLMGSGNGSYSWTGPNSFTSNDQNPTVMAAGTYVLTVLGDNGCTSTANAEVILNDEAPGAQASGGTLTCTTTSVMLMGSGNGSYSWTGPNNFTSNDQNPTVMAAGTYVLTVTGSNGCTSTANAEVILNDEVPGAQASGGTLTCTTTSVMLMGSGNGSYSWTGPNSFTSNDQNPTVMAPGTYVLTVTGSNGCTSQASAEVILNDEVPGAQATGGGINCNILSVLLNGSGNGSLSWNGPGGFSSTSPNPLVSVAGTYTLTVTGANGCTATAIAEVTVQGSGASVGATGGEISCLQPDVQLQGGSLTPNVSFAWTGPNGFTSSAQNPIVTVPGSYTLTVTGTSIQTENGPVACVGSTDAMVTSDTDVPTAEAMGGTLTCTTTSVMLLGSGNGSYSWTGPNGFTSNDQNPTVMAAGTYVLTVLGDNGCTSTANAEVILNDEAPGAHASGGTLTCTTTSVMLMGSGNGTYSWTGPNFSSILQNPTVTVAGTYVLTVTGDNDCTSMAMAFVISDTEAPAVSAIGGVLPCDGNGLMLDGAIGSSVESFAWSGPNGFTSTMIDPMVFAAGSYILSATGVNGCTAMATAEVTIGDCGGCKTPIILYCAPDTTVQCGTNLDEFHLGFPYTRKDKDCPLVNYYTYIDQYSGDCPYYLTRTWIIADESGDTARCVQTVTIVDTEAPVLVGIPADVTVECGQVPGAPDGIWAEDACKKDGITVYTEDVTKGEDKCSYIIERTWWAWDDCGNMATATQTITVVDTEPPMLMNVPEDMTAQCGKVEPAPKVDAEDACAGIVDVLFDEVAKYAKGKGMCSYTLVRTWTATDACGNTAIAQQLVTVEDTEAPVFECEEYEIKVPCGELPDIEECKVTDNCTNDLTVSFEETSTKLLNGTVLHVRTRTATDDCGNTAVHTQRIIEGCTKLPMARMNRMTAAPNPFAHQSRITFTSEEADEVTLEVLAADGRLITTLYRGDVGAGEERTVTFEPGNDPVANYLVRLTGRTGVTHLRLTSTR